MEITCYGWRNKAGTSNRECRCGSWKQHWLNFSGEEWPEKCSILGCDNAATLGAHVYNPQVKGEKVIPACDSCNRKSGEFSLKGGVTLVSANKQETCEK